MAITGIARKAGSIALAAVLLVSLWPGAAFAKGTQMQAGTVAVSAQSVKPKTSEATPKSLNSLYKPALKKAAGATGPFREFKSVLHSSYEAVYTLYDMNADGVPELVFHAGVYAGAGQNCYVYTVKGGKLKYCGKTNAGYGGVLGGRKCCYISQAHTGFVGCWSLKLKDYKLVRKSVFSGTDVGGGWQEFAKKYGVKNLTWSKCADYSLLKKKAKITSKRIYDASVSVQKSATYTGKALKPKVSVKYLGNALRAGKDYSVSYKNAKGKKVSAPKAAGTYKVTVKGKGSYKGSQTATFKVKKRAPVTVKAAGVKVTLPEYWRGKVEVSKSSYASRAYVTVRDKKGALVMQVQCAPKRSFSVDGQMGTQTVGRKSGAKYTAAVIWDSFGAMARYDSTVKLQSGGKVGSLAAANADRDAWIAKTNAYLKKAVLKKMKVG